MRSIIVLVAFLFHASTYADPKPLDLLKASDQARGSIKDGITWEGKVITVEDGDKSEREFLIKSKGDNAYVSATAPARTKGEVYIFNDRNMWFYKPSLKRPVAISARQKLSGQASNGDIASTHYARDYTPESMKIETYKGEKTAVLMLKAKSDNLTYDQIKYWISLKTQLAVKAEFLTLQGQTFKMAEMVYGNFLKVKGKKVPFISQLIIMDAKTKANKSTIEYKKPQIAQFTDSIFNVNNLSR